MIRFPNVDFQTHLAEFSGNIVLDVPLISGDAGKGDQFLQKLDDDPLRWSISSRTFSFASIPMRVTSLKEIMLGEINHRYQKNADTGAETHLNCELEFCKPDP